MTPFLLVGALLWTACGPEEPSEPAPKPEYTKPAADYAVGRGRKEAPAVRFVDVTRAAGLEFQARDRGARRQVDAGNHGQRLCAF